MLFPGSNHITFDVNVTGTSSAPTVRCVVGADTAQMFTARNTGGTTWEAEITVPAEVEQIPFKIEVQLNGRIFTPINRVLDVTVSKIAEPAVEQPVYVEPVQEIDEPKASPEPLIVPEPVVAKPTPIAQSLMKSFAEAKVQAAPSKKVNLPVIKPKNTSKLQAIAKKPVVKKAVPVKSVGTSLAEIASMNEVINQNQKGIAIAPAVQSGIPVTLKKGEVKYL